jgi:hypothetical protein
MGNSIGERLVRWQNSRRQTTDDVIARYAQPGAARPVNTPLTTGQHLFHLAATLLTCGLWAPVWLWCAMRGNRPRR